MFYKWAVEAVKYLHEEEHHDQVEMYAVLRRRETDLVGRLDGYVRLRADKEISAEQLARYGAETEQDLAQVRSDLKKLHARTVDWARIANSYLSFAEKAVVSFEKGDPDTKKTIFNGLGANQTLKDKNLCISLPKPMVAIRKVYLGCKSEIDGLEPEKALGVQGLFQSNDPAIFSLLRG